MLDAVSISFSFFGDCWARDRSKTTQMYKLKLVNPPHMCITIKITFSNIICRFPDVFFLSLWMKSAFASSKTIEKPKRCFSPDFFRFFPFIFFARLFSPNLSWNFFFSLSSFRYSLVNTEKILYFSFLSFFSSSFCVHVLGSNCSHLT